jgi:hypothetical protein
LREEEQALCHVRGAARSRDWLPRLENGEFLASRDRFECHVRAG